MKSINVGLASWIIQDGNYADFQVGKDYRFALQYHAPKGLECLKTGTPRRELVSAYRYDICGQVLYSSEEVGVELGSIDLTKKGKRAFTKRAS